MHKLIVCSQSKVLEAASRFGKVCSHVWNTRSTIRAAVDQKQEAEEGKIDLHDDDPEIVEYMLRFMYEGDYRLPSDEAPRPFWIHWDNSLKLKMEGQEFRWIEVALWRRSGALLQSIHTKWPTFSQVCVPAGPEKKDLRLTNDAIDV